MNRLFKLQTALYGLIDQYKDIDRSKGASLDWERMHAVSCAKVGYLLAAQRGLDPVLGACACAVHDFGRILTGDQAGHGEAGYLPVRAFLLETGLFLEEEAEAIAQAVRDHSKKSEKGSPLDELVKDADLIDYYSYGYSFKREEQAARFRGLAAAHGLSPDSEN